MLSAESSPGWREVLREYWLLTKPGIVSLLLITTLGGMFIAARAVPAASVIVLTSLGGALAAAGANVMNSYLDRDIDALMRRTSRRPMPRHAVPPDHALNLSLVLLVLAVLVLGVGVNWLSAALAALGYALYVGVYTLGLKRRTPQNIVIGGVAGAIPPLVGYAAVTGRLDLLAFYLFAIVFWWTPPHTWALAILVTEDYARARIPMLPVEVGIPETARHVFWYSILLALVTTLPLLVRNAGWPYAVVMALLNARQLQLAWQLLRTPDKAGARRLYKYSQAYLALLYLALVVDRLL